MRSYKYQELANILNNTSTSTGVKRRLRTVGFTIIVLASLASSDTKKM
jgi:hypothetical protein